MSISYELLSQFAKLIAVKDKKETETTIWGTAVEFEGSIGVQLDGSSTVTPVSTTANIKPGERALVTIKNHNAYVTGNISSPAARTAEVEDVKTQVIEVETVLADKVNTEVLVAVEAQISTLIADNVTINGMLTAHEANISSLTADNVTIHGMLTAHEAQISTLTADNATIKGTLTAHLGRIETLESTKITTEQLNASYANIDFANIGEAALKKLYSETGIIKNMVVSNGSITGELSAVTINGDLIKAGTIIADKLVVKGTDGILYKLNVDAAGISKTEAPTDTLHGSVITAKSIVAGKIDVDDLVAFGATIGGFHITTNSIYSGVKSSMTNTTSGIYLDTTGKMALGDGNSYLKYNGSLLEIAGKINATEGKIGGFTIDSAAIYYGSTSFNSSKGVYLGTDGISCGKAFGVDSDGKMSIRFYDDMNKEWVRIRTGDSTSPIVIEKESSVSNYLILDYTGIYRDTNKPLHFMNDFKFSRYCYIGTLDGPTGHHYIANNYYVWGINLSGERSKIIGLNDTDNINIGDATVAGIGMFAPMYFPNNTQIGTTANPSGDHKLANNKAVYCINSSGNDTRLIGLSTDDVIWVGHKSRASSILIYNNIELNERASIGTSEYPSGDHYMYNKRYIYGKTTGDAYTRIIGVTSYNNVAIGDANTNGIGIYAMMYFPNNSQVGTTDEPTGDHYLGNAKYVYGINKSGTAGKLIGLTSGDNVQIGSYGGAINHVIAYINYQYAFLVRQATADHSDYTDVFKIVYNDTLSKMVVQSKLIYDATTSTAANVVVGSTGILYRYASSSKRYKEAITEKLSDSLDPNKLYNLPVVEYVYKDGYLHESDLRYKQKFIGFIAENVDDIYPLATNYNEDGSVESWNVNIIVPAMLKLIQDQHATDILLATRLDSTSSRIESLQHQLNEAMLEIASLRKEIDILKAA